MSYAGGTGGSGSLTVVVHDDAVKRWDRALSILTGGKEVVNEADEWHAPCPQCGELVAVHLWEYEKNAMWHNRYVYKVAGTNSMYKIERCTIVGHRDPWWLRLLRWVAK
jgi:hypothetical protein